MDLKKFIEINYKAVIEEQRQYENGVILSCKNEDGQALTFKLRNDGNLYIKDDLLGHWHHIKGKLFKKE